MKKGMVDFDAKQKVEIEDAKIKAAEQHEATMRYMEEQKAAYERQMVDD